MSDTLTAAKIAIELVGQVAIAKLDEKNGRIEKLERELNEAKDTNTEDLKRLKEAVELGSKQAEQFDEQLAYWEALHEQTQAELSALRSDNERLRTHLAGLQKQIKGGELVPVKVCGDYIDNFCRPDYEDFREGLKQFAAERAKETQNENKRKASHL